MKCKLIMYISFKQYIFFNKIYSKLLIIKYFYITCKNQGNIEDTLVLIFIIYKTVLYFKNKIYNTLRVDFRSMLTKSKTKIKLTFIFCISRNLLVNYLFLNFMWY